MTTEQMAVKLRMTSKGVRYRLKKKGLFVKIWDYDYSHDDFLQIYYEKYNEIQRNKIFQKKKDLEIIHLFFTTKDNDTNTIAKKLNDTYGRVNSVINRFLKTGEIVIQSKMNYD